MRNGHLVERIEAVQGMEVEQGYTLSELTGSAFKNALRESIPLMEERTGQEVESVPALISWVEDNGILFDVSGDLTNEGGF